MNDMTQAAPGTVPAAAGFTAEQLTNGEQLRGMSTRDLVDMATMKAAHLEAMLLATYGEQAFAGLGEKARDEYMWACSTLSHELRACIRELTRAERRREAA